MTELDQWAEYRKWISKQNEPAQEVIRRLSAQLGKDYGDNYLRQIIHDTSLLNTISTEWARLEKPTYEGFIGK